MAKALLKQFIRGTTDKEMLTKLRLEDKVDRLPPFPILLVPFEGGVKMHREEAPPQEASEGILSLSALLH